MKLVQILFVLAFLIGASSCKKIDAAKGDTLEFNVPASSFDGIHIQNIGTVYYTDNTTSLITVHTTQKVFDVMTFEVVNNTLEIDVKKGYTIKNGENVRIYISEPLVRRFYISGSGYIEAEMDSSAHNSCSIQISGSGDIYANKLNCTTLDSKISGSGEIYFQNSSATNAEHLISGSGTIRAFNLFTTDTETSISGSGNMEVRATGLLNVNISGSGTIYYKDYPTISTNISGSGNVVNSN